MKKKHQYGMWAGSGLVKIVGTRESPICGKLYLVRGGTKGWTFGTKEAHPHELKFITEEQAKTYKKWLKAR